MHFPDTYAMNQSAFSENVEENQNLTKIIEQFKMMWPVDEWVKMGHFDEQYIHDINVHWLKFSPPNPSSFYSLAALYILMMTFGVTGNFLVIYLFIKCKALRTPANTLIVNLAVSDGLMTMKAPIFIYNSINRGPALGDKACRIYGFLGGLTGTLSIITLSVISFDRYFVIQYPLKRSFSDLRIKICLVVAWVYGAIFAVIPTLDIGMGKYTYEGYLTSCSFDYLTDDRKIKNFILVFFVAAWVLPFILISFSYFNIIKVVAGRTISHKRGRDSFRHVKEEDNKKQEIKLAFVVLSTVMIWFMSWTPYAVVALLGVFDQKQLITPLTSMIPAVFCKAASCINSYVYALSHPKFKKELRKICCSRLKKKREKKHKVWHTEFSRNQMQMDHFDSEEEVIEINMRQNQQIPFHEKSQKTVHPERTLKREETVIELLCLRPSFRNKPSSFRRVARRWSAKDKQRNESEDIEANVDTMILKCLSNDENFIETNEPIGFKFWSDYSVYQSLPSPQLKIPLPSTIQELKLASRQI